MKTILKQYASSNKWANQRIIAVALELPEEVLTMERTGSFSSIHKTLLHIWDAESGWWQRLKLEEKMILPSAHFKGTTRDIADAILRQDDLYEQWVYNSTPAGIDHVMQFYNSKREPVKMHVSQLLLHVFNHSTYHRGQLVNQLREAGLTNLPSTDFFYWLKTAKKSFV